MQFQLIHKDSKTRARAGLLATSHGEVKTPAFMPVGTLGTVKGVHQRELSELGVGMILANTYHLYLRPGMEVLEKAGGLHKFMGWKGPILTDSGGYQVYSLGKRSKITEEGVHFSAHTDGSYHLFTPELVIDAERKIGADIIMAFDECTPEGCSYSYAKESVELTHRWLERCCNRLEVTSCAYGYEQCFFPIVQGSTFKELRKKAVDFVTALDQVGYGIGGVCHPTGHLYQVTSWVCDALPEGKARYLMGVGKPEDLLQCIALGVDMFDCVIPARNGRHGLLFTTKGVLNIRNHRWLEDFSPIDKDLEGYASTHYTKSYLHHLIRSGERLGAQIATLHNLRFYLWLVEEARRQILKENFGKWHKEILPLITRRL